MVTCAACQALNDTTTYEPGAKVSCCKCQEVFTVPARDVATAGQAKPKKGLALASLTDAQLVEKCRPVLIYYTCAPITDPQNQNWGFMSKLEMKCFARADVVTVLKEGFALEKVQIDYKLQTKRGLPVPPAAGETPVASAWDYRMARVVFTTFDGKQKLREITAKDGDPVLKSYATFLAVLKQVQGEHLKYVKELRKAEQAAQSVSKA